LKINNKNGVKMPNENKSSECFTIYKWKNYNLSAWLNHGKENQWFAYEIQRNAFLGVDKSGKKSWSNQSLSLTKLEDLCYLKTIINYLIPKLNDNPIQKFSFVGQKVFDEEQKAKWKDKEKPTKQELKDSLKLIHFYRNYIDKDNKTQKTKLFVIRVSEIDILRDFVQFCISKIHEVYKDSRKEILGKKGGSAYQDNIDYSQEEEFVEEKIDDDIPF